MADVTSNTAARLTISATAYLCELQSAAELVQLTRERIELEYRADWLSLPLGLRRNADTGDGGASNSPLRHVNGYIHDRLVADVKVARRNVGRVAWWYATAALAALDAVLAGQAITARQLEFRTLLAPGRDHERLGDADPWAPCFRAHLPGDGELRTGNERLDTAMAKALTPLREAYAAALTVEAPTVDDPDPDEDEEMSEREAAQLQAAHGEAERIPDLLIAYARAVGHAAHHARV